MGKYCIRSAEVTGLLVIMSFYRPPLNVEQTQNLLCMSLTMTQQVLK